MVSIIVFFFFLQKTLNHGVSQGFILSPLLFLISVKDFHKIAFHYTNDVIKQYADDKRIHILKASNITELKFKTNALLSRTEQWSFANKLTINMD